MTARLAALVVALAVVEVTALKIDISHAEIDAALTLSRATDAERARFHAPYIQQLNTPFIEQAEVVSEFRRVVLMAEQQIARGDRFFAYSSMRATTALEVFRKRVSVVARVRFHPQNNYVGVPEVTLSMIGNESALVGVRREPIYGFAGGPKESAPVMGAVVEASFRAEAVAEGKREFRVSLGGKELGRFAFDFAVLD